MPYKDWAKQREYQRQYRERRRAEVFKDQRCARCGATENLELHHIDPAEKLDHRIWFWSWQRIQNELAKCEILCRNCHGLAHGRHYSKSEQAAIAARITSNLDLVF
jgi:5-methylcytosine-specific restriction endonuclease McrA